MQLKNEAYLVEMAQIMDGFNQYIPSEESLQTLNVNGTDHTYDGSKLMQILFFGDQLTVARARGASTLREPQMKCLDRLEGFVPTIADWHARMCLLQVCFLWYFIHVTTFCIIDRQCGKGFSIRSHMTKEL